ncbi:MAG: ABC transporter permease [Candidatus Omnitrophota bacterium]
MPQKKNRSKPSIALAWGTGLIGLLLILALLAPVLASFEPDSIDAEQLLSPPSFQHWMGTDQLGRDVLSRFLFGARISLTVGALIIVIAGCLGILIGSLSGYFGGWLDQLLMRFTDIMLCFPVFFLILSVIALIGSSVFNIILILGLTGWMGLARLVRAEILTLKNREYILVARAYGASDARLILRHLVPNASAPIFVTMILGIASAILAESALSFLGVGIQPPTPSWGNMLNDARATLGVAWWMSLFPGLGIFCAILGFHLIGEGLRNPAGGRP